MHVVQPYPTILNPICSNSGKSPDSSRYLVTTFDPGARLVLTHSLGFNPSSLAFFATKPAATITVGFDVLVQLVIAAIKTEPSESRSCVIGFSPISVLTMLATSLSFILSCGRLGPDKHGSISERFSSMTSV